MKEREFYKKMLSQDFTPDFQKISEDIADENTKDIHAENREKIKIRRGGAAAAVCATVCLAVLGGVFALIRGGDFRSGDTDSSVSSNSLYEFTDGEDMSGTENTESPTIEYLIEHSNSIVQLKVLDTDGKAVSDSYGYYRKYTVSEYTNWHSTYDTEFDKRLYGLTAGNGSDMSACLPAGEDKDITLETGKTYLMFVNNESLNRSDYYGLFELENGTAEKISGKGKQQFPVSELYFAKRHIQYGSNEKDIMEIDYSDQRAAYNTALNAAGQYLGQCGIESCTLSQPFECNNSDGTKCGALGFFILSDGKIYGDLTVKKNETWGFDVIFYPMEMDISEWNEINGPFAFVIDNDGKTMAHRAGSDTELWENFGFTHITNPAVYTCDLINMGDVCTRVNAGEYDFLKDTENFAVYKFVPDGERKLKSEDGAFNVEYDVVCDDEKAVLSVTYYNNTDYDLTIEKRLFASLGINGRYEDDISVNTVFYSAALAAHSSYTKTCEMLYSEWIKYSGNQNHKWNDDEKNTLYIDFNPELQINGEDNIHNCAYRATKATELIVEYDPSDPKNSQSVTETPEPEQLKFIPDGENKFVSEDGKLSIEYKVSCDSKKSIVNMIICNNTDNDMIIDNKSSLLVGINGEYTFAANESTLENAAKMPVAINQTLIRAHSKCIVLDRTEYSQWSGMPGNDNNEWHEGERNTLYVSCTPRINILDGLKTTVSYKLEQPMSIVLEAPAEPENTSGGDYQFLQEVDENAERPVYELIKTGENTYSSADGAFRAETWLEYDGEQAKLYVYYHNDTDYDLVAGEPYSPVMGINSNYTAEIEKDKGYGLGEVKAHTSSRRTYTLPYENYIYPTANKDENDKQFNFGQNKWNDSGMNVINIKFKISLSLKDTGDVNGCSYAYPDDIILSYEI